MNPDEQLSIEEIARRLSEIDEALHGPARDPSPEQYALLVERDRLRSLAAEYRAGRDSRRTFADLQAELASMRRQLKSQVSSHTGYVTSKGGNNQGPTPGAWVTLAARSREESDIARLYRRIGEIESELQRREVTD